MALRLGLGISRGTPLVVGLMVVIAAVGTWWAGFSVAGALLFVVGAAILLERRRSASSLSEDP